MLRDAHRTIKPLACPRAPHVEDDDGQPLDGLGTSMPRPTLPTLPGLSLHLRPPRRRRPVPVPSTIPGRIPRRSAPPRARIIRRVPVEETGAQRHSKALRGTQRHSKALKGTQRHSKALRGTQRHSEALSGHQRQPKATKVTQSHSEPLRGNRRHSEPLRGHRRLSACTKASRGRRATVGTGCSRVSPR